MERYRVRGVSLFMLPAACTFTRIPSLCSFLLALTVSAVPAFAQSNTAAHGIGTLERTSATATREYAPARWLHVTALPPNLIVAPEYRLLLARMLERSPAFRRQCHRIANAEKSTIHLRRAERPFPHGIAARTQISTTPAGGLIANVELPQLDEDAELIAHEIEHVVEQLDSIDLVSKARRRGTGVRAILTDCTVFETTRAVRIGRLVAEEVRRFAR